MNLDYVPLLDTQRKIYRLPHGMLRFDAYLRTMMDPNTGDLGIPLTPMNPMGRDHVPAFLDRLLGMDADGIGTRATAEAAAALAAESGQFKVCMVVSDDLMGGWTNRYAAEFGYRFEQKSYIRRRWLPCLLWTGDTYTPERVREETLLCIYRAVHIQHHGYAHTLGEMLAQEGYAMRMAGSAPSLDPDDLEYTGEVLARFFAETNRATLIAALFGDEAARQLGYPPLGLSPRAGLAFALSYTDKVKEKQKCPSM